MKQTSEALLAFAERELVHKESIRTAVQSGKPQRTGIVWTKVLLPIAACLVLLCGTVLAIPSARAEVARWFRIERPEQYLTEDHENRTPVDALDTLILKPAASPTATTHPVDSAAPTQEPSFGNLPDGSVTDNRILYVADEPLWQRIAENFSVTIGETMFDGESLYITVTLRGLTALPALEQFTGGNLFTRALSVDELTDLFEDGKVPEAYRNGTEKYYDWDFGARYALVFEDGAELWLGPIQTASLDGNLEWNVFQNQLIAEFGREPYSDAVREQINERTLSWISDAEITAVIRHEVYDIGGAFAEPVMVGNTFVQVDDIGQYLLERTDENGILHATLRYCDSQDRPEGWTKLLEADLGTVAIHMTAVGDLSQSEMEPQRETARFGQETAILSFLEWIETAYDATTATVINREVDLSEVALTGMTGGYRNGLGIYMLKSELTLPKDWPEETCETFLSSLSFYAEANGLYYTASFRRQQISGHTWLITVNVNRIPYDCIGSIETVRLIPVLYHITHLCADGETVALIPDVQTVAPDAERVGWEGTSTEYPDAALIYTVRP